MKLLGQDENLSLIRLSGEKDLPTLLIGDTGSGKTSAVSQIAKEFGKKSIRFPLTGETTTNEFAGRFELDSSGTIWVDGPLVEAMKNGYWFVADEINMALPEILSMLHPLLDHDKMVVVNQRNGQVIKPHEDFRFFATMNPVTSYSGTKELNKAFMSRFPVILNFDYPDVATEAQIIQGHSNCNEDTALNLAEMAHYLRETNKEDVHSYICSTRDLIYCGQLVSYGLDLAQAINISIINRCDEYEKETITSLIKEKINKIKELLVKNESKSIFEFIKELDEEKRNYQKLALNLKSDSEKALKSEQEKLKKAYESEFEQKSIDLINKYSKLENQFNEKYSQEFFEENYIGINRKNPVIHIHDMEENYLDGVTPYKVVSFVGRDANKSKRVVAHIGFNYKSGALDVIPIGSHELTSKGCKRCSLEECSVKG